MHTAIKVSSLETAIIFADDFSSFRFITLISGAWPHLSLQKLPGMCDNCLYLPIPLVVA